MCIMSHHIKILIDRIAQQFIPIGSLMFGYIEIPVHLSGSNVYLYRLSCFIVRGVIQNIHQSFIPGRNLVGSFRQRIEGTSEAVTTGDVKVLNHCTDNLPVRIADQDHQLFPVFYRNSRRIVAQAVGTGLMCFRLIIRIGPRFIILNTELCRILTLLHIVSYVLVE